MPASLLAVEGRNGDENEVRVEERFEQRIERDDDRVRIEIRQRIRQENEAEDEVEIRERIEQKVEIQGNRFEISGRISAIASDNFTIAGNTIFIDPSIVREFEQKGTLKVGEDAKVEGVIVDDKKFAEEIRVFRDDQEMEIKLKQGADVRVRARGPLDQIRDLLNQILNLLRGRS